MEQNCAVWITVVFLFIVMGLGFLFPAGGGGKRGSKQTNNEGR